MTLDDVLKILAAECERAGSQTAWGAALGYNRRVISDVLARRRPPSDRMLAALGLEKVATVSYRRKR